MDEYLNEQIIKDFYSENKEILKKEPIAESELLVYQDQFEHEFKSNCWKEQDQCAICYEDPFEEQEQIIDFPGCGHNFHFKCLEKWLSMNSKCPICKAEFREAFVEKLCDRIVEQCIKENKPDDIEGTYLEISKKTQNFD